MLRLSKKADYALIADPVPVNVNLPVVALKLRSGRAVTAAWTARPKSARSAGSVVRSAKSSFTDAVSPAASRP